MNPDPIERGGRSWRHPLHAMLIASVLTLGAVVGSSRAQVITPVPPNERGQISAERSGFHDAANIRTVFWNYGMVGDYPRDPLNVDLSVFHSAEVPKGSGMNYSDGITPFVLARIDERNGRTSYIMETGYRERQAPSPRYPQRDMRFEPRPGYFEADPLINAGRSPALSSDPRTWPEIWPDRRLDPDDPGWSGKWNGYFGKRPAADQESYTVMDDDLYEAWDFRPDSRDSTRHGLGLRIEVRGFQWANPQAGNVIFWHYDITNEGTTDYNDNIIFGLYMDSGVGGSAVSCDGIAESDDDNAYFNRTFDQKVINLVYTWDKRGRGVDLGGNCSPTGYLGYAYLETPGNAVDAIDNDEDGITNERRDGGPGEEVVGKEAIRAYVNTHYNMARFEAANGPLEKRPAYRVGRWWTGDEDLDWIPEFHDTGADGIFETNDTGERDGIPTAGEPYFDRTDLNESDQIGLTGFKMNRIKAGQQGGAVDNIVFFERTSENWPRALYEQFTDPDPAVRFDSALEYVQNYNIGFLFASGPFTLAAGKTERFSLALGYGGDLDELRRTVETVQQIYNANYQFAVPPPMPTLTAESGDGYVRLSWDDVAERGIDPVTNTNDFEGYRIYRATDPEFRDPRVVTTGTGSGPIGNGRPSAQFDLRDGKKGFSNQTVEGVAYYLGKDTGIRHTWTDSTVTNGQEYYYAVTCYDFGSDSLNFYPSESAIAVSRTPRGGTILPINVVAVRPEPKVPGYVDASTGRIEQIAGDGTGTVDVQVVNSNLVPDGHRLEITFTSPDPDSLRAASYTLADSTAGEVLFKTGYDLNGLGTGPVGSGLLPVISTLKTVVVDTDTTKTGFIPGGPTNTRIHVSYQAGGTLFPINLRRVQYPNDFSIVFDDTVIDSSYATWYQPGLPAKFRVVAHTPEGDQRMDFLFYDPDGDGTLSRADEYVDILTYRSSNPLDPRATWRAELDMRGQSERGPILPPASGDVFRAHLLKPYGAADVFRFSSRGESVSEGLARSGPKFMPYVVPNPYVGSASFEPERFAISGRGERRIEFRGLPRSCTIRIYTVRGDLVETLTHDGSDDGFVAWNLRTKDNLDAAPGLYVYHVDANDLGTSIGKFAIIK